MIYRVGGSVRDALLGREPKDDDFVVVGETVEQFLQQFPNAQRVGNAFPVFLVKGVGEFAFARKERKSGVGYRGFQSLSSPDVTLEEDLARRDLTCNAIALPHVHHHNLPLETQVVDPFGGVADIKAGVLRHVGPAFSEDPLRVFRVARFAAQLGFEVHQSTLQIMGEVLDGEILTLSAERVGEELRKALRTPRASRFVRVLHSVGKLWLWFPELAHLENVPAGKAEHHGEGDALTHTLMALDSLPADATEAERLAALFHDLGKGITAAAHLPSHPNHDEAGVPLVECACDRLKLPKALTQAAVTACREHMRVHGFLEMRKGKMADLVKTADSSPLSSEGLAMVCLADGLGRVPPKESTGAHALIVAAKAARAESGRPIPEALKGREIGLHIRARKGAAARRALHAAKFLPRGSR